MESNLLIAFCQVLRGLAESIPLDRTLIFAEAPASFDKTL